MPLEKNSWYDPQSGVSVLESINRCVITQDIDWLMPVKEALKISHFLEKLRIFDIFLINLFIFVYLFHFRFNQLNLSLLSAYF